MDWGGAGGEEAFQPGRLGAEVPGETNLGVEVGRGHPHVGARRVEELLGTADVGTLAHEFRGEAHREFFGEVQLVEGKGGEPAVAGEAAGKDRQLVARLRQLLLQGGKGRPQLGELEAGLVANWWGAVASAEAPATSGARETWTSVVPETS